MNRKHIAGAGALGLAYFATRGSAAPGTTTEQHSEQTEQGGPVETFEPWTDEDEVVSEGNTADEGEVGRSANGVAYDDPETGEHNDEPEDDRNATFEDANEVAEETGAGIVLPGSYAPDDGGSTTGDAPGGGVLADAGDSQVWGSEPEQANDDLNDAGNFDEDAQSRRWGDAFDRLANADTTAGLV